MAAKGVLWSTCLMAAGGGAIVLIVLFTTVPDVHGFNKHGDKTFKATCTSHNHKLLSILNILCNNTQNTSIVSRDACYGCFFRAGGLTAGNNQLVALGQCATAYLNNTAYQVCAQQLQNVINGYRPLPSALLVSAAGCYQGYCEFVRCVRRTNANSLIDNCFLNTLSGSNLTQRADRIAMFTNLTSCVLSRTRCSAYNPITGELQSVRPQRPAGRATYNALQITQAGDIRVVTFPGTVGVAEFFCSARSTLEQDSYDNSDC